VADGVWARTVRGLSGLSAFIAISPMQRQRTCLRFTRFRCRAPRAALLGADMPALAAQLCFYATFCACAFYRLPSAAAVDAAALLRRAPLPYMTAATEGVAACAYPAALHQETRRRAVPGGLWRGRMTAAAGSAAVWGGALQRLETRGTDFLRCTTVCRLLPAGLPLPVQVLDISLSFAGGTLWRCLSAVLTLGCPWNVGAAATWRGPWRLRQLRGTRVAGDGGAALMLALPAHLCPWWTFTACVWDISAAAARVAVVYIRVLSLLTHAAACAQVLSIPLPALLPCHCSCLLHHTPHSL